MNKVSVDLVNPTYYEEPNSSLYRFRRKLTYGDFLRRLKPFLKNSDSFSLLEIGTGSGFFISLIESKFPKAKLTGLEFDPRLVKVTQDKVISASIIQGNAEVFELDQKFDLVVSSQVIEHLYNPAAMVQNVLNHLKPGGIFLFTSPNLDSVAARVMKTKWHGFRDDHVSLKNCDQWVALAEANGFKKLYSGSTFFTGIPILNKLPLGLINWGLLYIFGSIGWKHGESFIGIFQSRKY